MAAPCVPCGVRVNTCFRGKRSHKANRSNTTELVAPAFSSDAIRGISTASVINTRDDLNSRAQSIVLCPLPFPLPWLHLSKKLLALKIVPTRAMLFTLVCSRTRLIYQRWKRYGDFEWIKVARGHESGWVLCRTLTVLLPCNLYGCGHDSFVTFGVAGIA